MGLFLTNTIGSRFERPYLFVQIQQLTVGSNGAVDEVEVDVKIEDACPHRRRCVLRSEIVISLEVFFLSSKDLMFILFSLLFNFL